MLTRNGETYSQLLERIENDPYHTVFLIGNGIVKNGHEVLQESIGTFLGRKLLITPIDVISYLVFQARLFSKDGTHQEIKKDAILKLSNLKDQICKSFKKAQQDRLIEIKEGKDFVADLSLGKTVIITTNWDSLLYERYQKEQLIDVLSLHGSTSDPSGIYLPSETSLEPYWDADKIASGHLDFVHKMAVIMFENAKRIVIWGHSLNSYDAEVAILLTCAREESGLKREYFVIDPDLGPVERLKFLVNSDNVKHVNPTLSQI